MFPRGNCNQSQKKTEKTVINKKAKPTGKKFAPKFVIKTVKKTVRKAKPAVKAKKIAEKKTAKSATARRIQPVKTSVKPKSLRWNGG